MSVRKLCEIVSLLLNWAFLLQSRLVACPSSTISHLCNQFVLGIFCVTGNSVCPAATKSCRTGFKLRVRRAQTELQR